MRICIADLPVEWQEEYSDYVKAFYSEAFDEPVMSISFEKSMPECHGIQYSDAAFEHVLRLENGELLCANADWSKVRHISRQGRESMLCLLRQCVQDFRITAPC